MTDKKLANIVINDVLRHYKCNKCIPEKVDAELLAKLAMLVDLGFVSRAVFKCSDLWKTVLEARHLGSRAMLFHVLDSKFFIARSFFDDCVQCLHKTELNTTRKEIDNE